MTSMSSFIKAISTMMQDRQEFSLTAIKVKEDLVVTVVPNKKSGKVHHITIPAEDLTKESLDADLIGIIGTPIENKAEFSAQTSEVEVDEDDEDGKKEEDPSKKDAPNTKSGKKAAKADKPATKSAPKKTRAKGKQAPAAAVETETATVVPAEANNTQDNGQNGGQDAGQIEEPVSEIKNNEPELPLVVEEVNAPALAATNEEGPIDNNQTPAEPVAEEEDSVEKTMFAAFMADGRKAFAERDYTRAAVAFGEAVQLFPDNEEAKREQIKAEQWASAMAKVNKQ